MQSGTIVTRSFLLLLVVMIVALWPSPAYAHAGGAPSPTNFVTEIDSFVPERDGIELSVVDLGDRLRLSNDTNTEVVVEGYEGEPYLRVGPEGTYANTRSPAYYINRTLDLSAVAPPSADARAAPEWRKISADGAASWHDHRAHWMGVADPPSVARDPSRRHVVIPEWTVTMRHGQDALIATGNVSYVPPGSSVQWWALVAAAGLVGASVTARYKGFGRVPAALVVMMVAVHGAHMAGELLAPTSASGFSRLEVSFIDTVPSFLAAVMGLFGALRLSRHKDEGLWTALFATALIAVIGGISEVGFFSSSQVPSVFDPDVAKALVALSAGLGTGVSIALIASLKRAIAEARVQTENQS